MFYERFLKILKDFVNLTGKQLRWSFFLKNFLINFIKKELQHSFLVKFCEIFKNTYCEEHLRTTVAEKHTIMVGLLIYI